MNKQLLILWNIAFMAFGCYKEVDYNPLAIEPEEVIVSIRTTKLSLVANNSDTTMVTVVLPQEAQTGVDIVLLTHRGVFSANGTNTITVKSKAAERNDSILIIGEAILRNGLSTGAIEIEASVNDYSRSIEIASVRNPATGINLSSSATALSNNPTAEVELTATIATAGGTVSQGQVITITAIDTADAGIGTFRVRPTYADASGKAVYLYGLVPDSTYHAPFRIVASTQGVTETFRDTLTLYAID